MSKDHRTIWLAANLADLSVARVESLLTHYASWSDINQSSLQQLQDTSLTAKQASRLKQVSQQALESAWQWASSQDCHLITYNDAEYPQQLKHIHQPPPVLYVKGQKEALNYKQLAIVGTRHPTSAGRNMAYQMAEYLAQLGWVVTSGLAFGIDIAAHNGALQQGASIGVLATGLDVVYPACHRQQAQAMMQAGAVVSEMPLGTHPKPRHFPRRNRLISGLSQGVLVVEATAQSGSLHTAHFALEQDRDVFAVPGSVNSPQSKGCHALIKQGAQLVECADDILQAWPAQLSLWQASKPNAASSSYSVDPMAHLTEIQQQLVRLMGVEPVTVDELVEKGQFERATLVTELMQLELQGYIQSVPGGYVRC